MPEQVGVDTFGDARLISVTLDQGTYPPGGELVKPVGLEQVGRPSILLVEQVLLEFAPEGLREVSPR
jgi:hypothetical protein